jgi:DNA polymerase-3 subunit delta
MMSGRRVVVITDVRVSATGFRDTLKETDEDALRDYLTSPAPDTVLLVVADELNGNRKLTKVFKELACCVEFINLDSSALAVRVRRELDEAGATADDATIELVVELCGPDLRRVVTETQKLITAALPDKVVTRQLVEQLVPFSRRLENWQLTDDLVAGRKAAAISLLRKLVDDGAEPLAILGLLASNYRKLLVANDLMASNASRSEVMKAARPPYKKEEPFLAYARRTTPDRLVRAIERIAETDVAIKNSIGGSDQGVMQLEVLFCDLALLA